MSGQGISPRNRKVVAVAMLVFGAMAANNLRHHLAREAPELASPVSIDKAPAEFSLPPDLGENARVARSFLAGAAGSGGISAVRQLAMNRSPSGHKDRAVRDPFLEEDGNSGLTDRDAPADRNDANEYAFCCEAVVLGGDRPAVLLDGELHRVGDRVKGLRIERIDKWGVHLTGPGGSRFLSVLTHASVGGNYRLRVDREGSQVGGRVEARGADLVPAPSGTGRSEK